MTGSAGGGDVSGGSEAGAEGGLESDADRGPKPGDPSSEPTLPRARGLADVHASGERRLEGDYVGEMVPVPRRKWWSLGVLLALTGILALSWTAFRLIFAGGVDPVELAVLLLISLLSLQGLSVWIQVREREE